MDAHRTSISLNADLFAAAKKRLREKMHSNFSDYIESLIREDVLRQNQKSTVAEEPAPYPAKKRAS